MICWICHKRGADTEWAGDDGFVARAWYHKSCLDEMLSWMRFCGLPVTQRPRCPDCRRIVTCSPQPMGKWAVYCYNCYDGAPDSRPLTGSGDTEAEALDDYRDTCEVRTGTRP